MIVVGSMVGSGIFFVPAIMVAGVGSAPLVLAAFLVGGLLSLAGAFVFADLAAAFPRAGGQAVYLREAFGKLPAFLFTWSSFTAIQSATIAAIAIAFAQTADGLWGLPGPDAAVGLGPVTLPSWGTSFLAVAIVWLLTAVNYLGVRRGALLNNAATVTKLAGLALVVFLAFAFGSAAGNYRGVGVDLGFGEAGLGAVGLALVAALFAYDGWAQPTFVASEVRNPRRNVPLALIIGVATVMLVYITVSAAYFHVLPVGDLGSDSHAAEDTARAALAGTGAAAAAGTAVALAILVSTFGATNAYVLTSPRIYYDEATEGGFPRAFGRLSRFRTPGHGLVYQGVWASLMALTGTFDQLAFLIVFVAYVFYVATALGAAWLRRRRPEAFAASPTRWWPVPLVLFVAVGLAILANVVVEDPRTAVWGALLIVSGLPVHWALRRAGATAESAGPAPP